MRKEILKFSFILCLSTCTGQKLDLADLKKSVDQSWKTTNPTMQKTKPSFFNEKNHSDFLILELNFGGSSKPFVWDCDFTILDFLSKNEYQIKKENHQFKDIKYSTTTIKWNNDINGLLWFRNEIHKSKIDNWFLGNYFDCVGIISFPMVRFEKIVELENARTNFESGLAIIPFSNEIQNIVRNEIKLYDEGGKLMKGKGYDVNNDNVTDIFIHYQELDEEGFTGYKRLYLNINGNWTCKWIEYYEECI